MSFCHLRFSEKVLCTFNFGISYTLSVTYTLSVAQSLKDVSPAET